MKPWSLARGYLKNPTETEMKRVKFTSRQIINSGSLCDDLSR